MRPGSRGCPTPATARAPPRGRPGRGPPRPRRHARCESARRSAGPTRSAIPRRSRGSSPGTPSALLAALDLVTHPRLALPQLGCELLAEVLGLGDLAQLDLDAAAERRALEPLDRLVARRALPDPVPRDDLLRLGERAVDDGRRVALEAHLRAVGGGSQALAGEHDARLHELL